MQQLNMKDIETAVNQYGEVVLTKNSQNNVVVMSMEEYKNKLRDNEIEKKLKKAEKQIKEGKTVKAKEVFEELEKKYGF